jgi:hypothetical protein
MRVRFVFVIMLAMFLGRCAPVFAQQSHSVGLKWTASTDAGVSYNIYRMAAACPANGTSGFSKITVTPVSATVYADSGIGPGAYCYYATAVLNGAESVPSNFVSAVILPAAPTSLSVTGTN